MAVREWLGYRRLLPRGVDVKASATVNVSCRRCTRGPVECIQPSRRGAYLRCTACGDIWLEDGLLLPRRSPVPAARRRRSDVSTGDDPAGVTEPVDSIQQLTERIAQLEEENRNLREAARAFGELAERLSRQLRGEEPPEGDPQR
jgi:hypothetical protein